LGKFAKLSKPKGKFYFSTANLENLIYNYNSVSVRVSVRRDSTAFYWTGGTGPDGRIPKTGTGPDSRIPKTGFGKTGGQTGQGGAGGRAEREGQGPNKE